jgi:HAMP domain-containing protein
VERRAAGHEVDRTAALEATYTWARGLVARVVLGCAVCTALLFAVVGVVAGATGSRLVQYGILGAAFGMATILLGVHSFVGAAMRPARVGIAGETGMGDSLPRSRPSFAAWSNVTVLAVAFTFAVAGALWAAVFDLEGHGPALAVVIGGASTLIFGLPITIGAAFSPSLQPIRDLARGTERVAAGDYSQRLPVYQDDDLGALSASFSDPSGSSNR